MDSQRPYYDEEAYLVPNQVNELQRKPSDITANGSDPDSVVDLYKTESKNGSKNGSQTALNNPKKKKKGGATKQWQEIEKDDNNWIHRDKLKEIESRELEAAGFRVGRSSRSNSRSQSANPRGRKNSEAAFSEPSSNGEEHVEQRRIVSPIPAAEEEDVEDDPANWDLRTPEEIAAEREFFATPRTNSHTIRPSTSRIPIAKLSPAPVPNTFVERDAPLPRSRKGSANWTGDAIATNGARVRSGSVSSQVLMDDPRPSGELLRTPLQSNFSNPTSPVTGSPPKAKTPGKAAATPGGRKTSAQRSTSQAKRTTSATSPVKRPGTSGGSISRPTTSHRPEGEAPWIATMYKPDPRLPPDQQIIPTHAKRMQQDQWETEGKHGSMYDREFRLLNTEEFKDKRASQISPLDIQNPPEDDEQWPLPSPTKRSIDKEKEPKSPVNEGAYKLTPTIPQSPRVPSRAEPRRPSISATATSPKPNTTRVPDLPAQEEKEKKGCCCIVM
jgi:hypothetical protein